MKSAIMLMVVMAASLFTTELRAQTIAHASKDVTTIQLKQVEGAYVTTELTLAPGQYIFQVTNHEVDKGLGFWLTPADDAETQIPNSGLAKLVQKGETSQTGVVTLAEGTYLYSCPLNPTPHYTITVKH